MTLVADFAAFYARMRDAFLAGLASGHMVDRDLLAAKLGAVTLRVARVRSRAGVDATAFAADVDAVEIVSFNLMLAVQSCVDVASHVVSDEGWPPADDAAGAFRRLADYGAISAPTAEAMRRAVGLRNVIAHAYGSVDVILLHRAATDGLADLERFGTELSRWAASSPQVG